ncbi:MAG: iron ABC transporter permease [Dehalococcoidia bacterium]
MKLGVAVPATEVAARKLPAWGVGGSWQFRVRLGLAIGLAGICILVSLSQGAADIPTWKVVRILIAALHLPIEQDWTATEETILLQVRLPRILMAATVGSTLAISGGAYQGVFRNPLADPYLIGAAAGAALGATIAIVSPLDVRYYPFSPVTAFAFAGALGASFLSLLLARTRGPAPAVTLILAGVAVSSFCTAVTSLLMLRSEDDTRIVLSWVLGGFNLASWDKMWLLLPYVVPAAALLLLHGRLLNALQLPEDEARQVGVDVKRVRLVIIAAASIATAAAVSVAGIVGFVGLVVPHTVRLLWGSDYRQILPLSAALGAALLVVADLFARTVIEPAELPVGILTAMLGAPFFLLLLRGRDPTVFR